jgi:hypothetical protein
LVRTYDPLACRLQSINLLGDVATRTPKLEHTTPGPKPAVTQSGDQCRWLTEIAPDQNCQDAGNQRDPDRLMAQNDHPPRRVFDDSHVLVVLPTRSGHTRRSRAFWLNSLWLMSWRAKIVSRGTSMVPRRPTSRGCYCGPRNPAWSLGASDLFGQLPVSREFVSYRAFHGTSAANSGSRFSAPCVAPPHGSVPVGSTTNAHLGAERHTRLLGRRIELSSSLRPGT